LKHESSYSLQNIRFDIEDEQNLMSPFNEKNMTKYSLHFTNKVIGVFGDFLN